MLAARHAILGLALLLAMIGHSSAQSQRRPQQLRVKQPETAVTQEKSHEDQRGTEQSPLIVKVAPAPKTDEQRTEETKERERIANTERKKEDSDTKLVEYTGQLAWFTKGLFIATSTLVVATLALGIAAFLQSRDMKRSLQISDETAKATLTTAKAAKISAAAAEQTIKIMEDTAERQLRAYIYALPLSMQNFTPSSFISFLFSEINAGKTPAYRTTHSGVISIEDHPLRPNFPFPELPQLPHMRQSRMLIGPGLAPGATIAATQKFSQAELVEICHGHIKGKRLYIFGQVDYTDAFKRKRWTRFCVSLQRVHELIPLAQTGNWQAIADLSRAEKPPKILFEIANQHNETDEG